MHFSSSEKAFGVNILTYRQAQCIYFQLCYLKLLILEGATQFEQEAAYCDYGLGLNKHSSITHDAVAHTNTHTQTNTNRLKHKQMEKFHQNCTAVCIISVFNGLHDAYEGSHTMGQTVRTQTCTHKYKAGVQLEINEL